MRKTHDRRSGDLVRIERTGSPMDLRFTGTREGLIRGGFAEAAMFPDDAEHARENLERDTPEGPPWRVRRSRGDRFTVQYFLGGCDGRGETAHTFRHAAHYRDTEVQRLRVLLSSIYRSLSGATQVDVSGDWQYCVSPSDRESIEQLGDLILELLTTARIDSRVTTQHRAPHRPKLRVITS